MVVRGDFRPPEPRSRRSGLGDFAPKALLPADPIPVTPGVNQLETHPAIPLANLDELGIDRHPCQGSLLSPEQGVDDTLQIISGIDGPNDQLAIEFQRVDMTVLVRPVAQLQKPAEPCEITMLFLTERHGHVPCILRPMISMPLRGPVITGLVFGTTTSTAPAS